MSDKHLQVIVWLDDEKVIDFDEQVLEAHVDVATPVREQSIAGPYQSWEHTGRWHLSVDALRVPR